MTDVKACKKLKNKRKKINEVISINTEICSDSSIIHKCMKVDIAGGNAMLPYYSQSLIKFKWNWKTKWMISMDVKKIVN